MEAELPDHPHPHPHRPGDDHHHHDANVPALLRAARGAYGDAIRARLSALDCDDLPRNGAFVLGGLEWHHGATGVLTAELGVSKQTVAQLIDTLAVRGYLERVEDPDEASRVILRLTARGRAAAAAVGEALVLVDDELAAICTPDQLAGLRAGLEALAAIRHRHRHDEERADH